MRFLAEPERRPKTPAQVIILGNAAPQATTLHETLPTDPLQAPGEPLPEFPKNRGLVPDILQTVCGCMPKDKLRHGLPDTTQGIGPICQNTKNT